jgi:serine/threonine protein kinase/tetratricopeptide (TPR) repeat protein
VAIKCPSCHADNPETLKFCGKCGTKLDASMPPQAPCPKDRASFTKTLETTTDELAPGTLFAGRYEIIEELGAGGMGRVYRTRDTKLKEEVALKLIKPEIAAKRRVIERFQNEIKVARKISHKNICRMYDLHEEGKTSYLTMEYVRGEDLKSLLHRTKILSIATALSIARQVAEGLIEAHQLGIVHRDLKPGNIMIDKDGNAKIMDFGIARVRQEKRVTGEGTIIGTPEYMSPEQVEGKEADQRSDIYALGVILFEVVTGQVPFEGETPFSIANKHKTEPPPIPKKLIPQIPDGLNKLILRCMEKDRLKRYQTAEELVADLTSVEESLPKAERVVFKRKTVTQHEITVKFQPRRFVTPAAIVFSLAIVFLLVRHYIVPRPAPAPSVSGMPTLAVLDFENKSGDSKLDSWRDALPELLITSLQQSRYIRVVSSDQMFTVLKRLGLADARRYSSEDIRKVATQTHAVDVLRGSYIKAGESFVITASLEKPGTGESSTPLRLEASSEKDIIVKVDELTRQVKEGLNLTPDQMASDIQKDAGTITTSSPEALKYYIEGRKLQLKLDFEHGIPHMEKAVEIDPEFAMAYRALAVMYRNSGHQADSWKYFKKALELSARLPEYERLLMEVQRFRNEQNYAKAIEVAEKLVKSYPGYSLGYSQLAYAYEEAGNLDKAIQYHESAYEIQKTVMLVGNLVYGYEWKGQHQKAEDLCRSFVQEIEDNWWLRECLGFICLHLRQFDAARTEFEKCRLLNPDLASLENIGHILLCKGDIAGAEKVYRQVFENDHATGRKDLIDLALVRGKYGQALSLSQQNLEESKGKKEKENEANAYRQVARSLEKAERYKEASETFNQYLGLSAEYRKSESETGLPYLPSQQKSDLFTKGRIQAEMRSFDEAGRTAGELKAEIDKGINTRELRFYEYILGQIELGRTNYKKAAEFFGTACSRLFFEQPDWGTEQAPYFDNLARSLYDLGNLDKARQEYEKITLLTSGRLNDGDIYARAFYMLGKIAEQQGDKMKARENYQKFLDLWKDADTSLPEVLDAKTRLAALGT